MSLVIAGERSGVGKTTITLALLAYLKRHLKHELPHELPHPEITVQSFKVGPDYIDPMFHHYVTGRPCRNLDPVLTSEDYVRQCFTQHTQAVEFALVEGVMGLFDGVDENLGLPNHHSPASRNDFASTAHIARLLDLPVLLVIDCSRLSGSVAAIAHGYRSWDPRINFAGLVLNRVGSDRHLELLKEAIAPLNLPILGVFRRQDNITIPDRHLGLIPTAELPEIDQLIDRLAEIAAHSFDWENLLPLLKTSTNKPPQINQINLIHQKRQNSPVKIGIARDAAFSFYYQDNLDILASLGAELIPFSPLENSHLPPGLQGLYFGGGFPEMFAQQLSENVTFRQEIFQAIQSGITTIAECGGLMYLSAEIIDFEAKSWPMVGILPSSTMMDRYLTLGYRRAIAQKNTPLLAADEIIFGHEFHRSRLVSEPISPLFKTWRLSQQDTESMSEGWAVNQNLHASYIHLHWGHRPEIAQRFLKSCQIFSNQAS
jgi:cobyrinic acid a,c-diamide synthase